MQAGGRGFESPSSTRQNAFLKITDHGPCALALPKRFWGGLAGLAGGLPGVVFFGAICLPYIVFRAVRPVSSLIVSTDGFTVHEYALDAGFISWEEVQSIETSSVGVFSWVVVRLRDPVAFVRRHRPVRRALLRLNSGLRRGYARISGVGLPLPVSEVAAIMEAKRSGPPDAAS